jgi:hypothetical protein
MKWRANKRPKKMLCVIGFFSQRNNVIKQALPVFLAP